MKRITLIAEIAQAHDGSLGIAHSLIDALAEVGVDAIKFQTHIADAESSEFETFRIPFSCEDANRQAYWKRMEFTPQQWQGLKSTCEQKSVEFISSPFSIAAVELLEQLNVQRYKIGSGEVNNWLMLEKIARTKKPIILSSGLSTFEDLDETINFLHPYNNKLSLLQCYTAYPTLPEQWQLNRITEMKKRYPFQVGFSDHSGNIVAPLAAAAMGAEIIEFHVTFDKRMFGPDAKASLTIDETKKLVYGIRQLEKALYGLNTEIEDTAIIDLKNLFGKSLAVNKNLPAGYILTVNDLESKKPADMGIPAKEFERVIGKKLNKNKMKWDFLTEEDIV
jgi:N,N'-diacetyllegionaminate synthase